MEDEYKIGSIDEGKDIFQTVMKGISFESDIKPAIGTTADTMPVYVFINEETISEDTMCDFTQSTLGIVNENSTIVPIIYSFSKDENEINDRLEKIGKSNLPGLRIAGRDAALYGETDSEKLNSLISKFERLAENKNIIIIEKGTDARSPNTIAQAVIDQQLGWLGLVNPDFPFRDLRRIKKLAREGKHVATIMTHVTSFLDKINSGVVPTEEKAVIEAITTMSPEMQTALLAAIEKLEKEVLVRQAA